MSDCTVIFYNILSLMPLYYHLNPIFDLLLSKSDCRETCQVTYDREWRVMMTCVENVSYFTGIPAWLPSCVREGSQPKFSNKFPAFFIMLSIFRKTWTLNVWENLMTPFNDRRIIWGLEYLCHGVENHSGKWNERGVHFSNILG